MKLGNPSAGRLGNAIANPAQLGDRDRELRCDDERDPRTVACERATCRGDPGREIWRPEFDHHAHFASETRSASPRAKLVLLDDLDDVPVENPTDFRLLRCGCHSQPSYPSRVILSDVKLGSVVVLCLVAAPAAAGPVSPLAEALARHSERDVTTLRAQRSEVGARCTLGAVYAKRKDLSRAALFLAGCDDATLPEDVATDIARIHRDVKKTLRDSDLAMIEVVTQPADIVLVAEIDALPGETFDTPATLYLKPGKYTVNAMKDGAVLRHPVVAEKRSRGVVIIETGTPKHTVVTPKTGKADFTDEAAKETTQKGPPPKVEHKNMLPDKYKKGIQVAVVETNPNAIEDPMATRETVRAPRAFWLGLRLGGGMFDDGAAGARAGIAVAATTRVPLSRSLFLAGRADWSRRGSAAIDTIGASAGVGYDTHMVGIALIGQLRGDLRFGNAMASRAGATAAVGAELALPRTPITAGLRFEQGLTTIVPRARDRAVLFELGFDWR